MSILLILIHFVHSNWPETHANIMANSALFFIVLLSLILQKPFTLQYAKEQVEQDFWETPSFIRINQMITAVWGASFLIAVFINLLQRNSIAIRFWTYQIISYGPSIFAIWFTKQYPEWHLRKIAAQEMMQSVKLQESNPYLKGNFAPVLDEFEMQELVIKGDLPQDLLGIYMRNGPNPAFQPFSYTYPFDGDGMLHAVYFKAGKAYYRNRFVETDQLQVERRIGKAMYGGVDCAFVRDSQLLNPTDPKLPVKLGRFIHIIRHAGHYLALHEANSAYEVTAELATLGEWNPTQEKEAIAVNAHTRLDPETGELCLIAYHLDKPNITYHVLDKTGLVTLSGMITVSHRYMIHDFVLTKHYLVIFLCPVIVDLAGRAKGKDFFNWQPELKTRIAVVSRSRPNPITWIETDAFFTYHFANAFEVGNEIMIDYVRYPTFTMSIADLGPAHLYRTTIHLMSATCSSIQLDDKNIEFPRINEAYLSQEYRYIYAPAKITSNSSGDSFDSLIKYDLKTNNHLVHEFGLEYEIGEAVFVPKINSCEEDDGYLMLYIYNRVNNQSDLVLLDAKNLLEKPLVRIPMPRRIPHGLHGSWFGPLIQNETPVPW